MSSVSFVLSSTISSFTPETVDLTYSDKSFSCSSSFSDILADGFKASMSLKST